MLIYNFLLKYCYMNINSFYRNIFPKALKTGINKKKFFI